MNKFQPLTNKHTPSSQLLLSIMEVFVREPHLDWVAAARGKKTADADGLAAAAADGASVGGSSSSMADEPGPETLSSSVASASHAESAALQWYPQTKIQVAEYKLRLVHPSSVLEFELQQSEALKRDNALQNSIAIVKGDPNTDARAKYGFGPCRSVSQQVGGFPCSRREC